MTTLTELNDFANRAEREEGAALRLRSTAATITAMAERLPESDLFAQLEKHRYQDDVCDAVRKHISDNADPLLRSAALALEAEAMKHSAIAGALRRSVDAVLYP